MTLLRRMDFRRLLIGQSVSGLGDWMATFAFLALTERVTDSAVAVGGILTLRLLPAALGGTVAARIACRWDRRKAMVAMDLTRAGIIALVPFIRALWWIYLLAFLLEAASIVFVSSRDASIGDLAEEKELPLANGLVLGTSYGSIPIGAGLFALIAALPFNDAGWLGSHAHAVVFWVDSVTFLVSAYLISRITTLVGRARPADVAEDPPVGHLRDALRIPLVRAVMPAAATVAFGLGALFSLGIVLVREELHASDAEFGVLVVLFGAGAAAGLGITQLRSRSIDLVTQTRQGVVLMGLLVALMSLSPAVSIAYLGAVGFGMGATIALTSGMSAIQAGVGGEGRVLAFAAFHVIIRLGLVFGALLAGGLGDLLPNVAFGSIGSLASTRIVLLGAGALAVVSGILMQAPNPIVPSEGSPDRAGRHRH